MSIDVDGHHKNNITHQVVLYPNNHNTTSPVEKDQDNPLFIGTLCAALPANSRYGGDPQRYRDRGGGGLLTDRARCPLPSSVLVVLLLEDPHIGQEIDDSIFCLCLPPA